ncbi:hypothetical protein B0T25DRAFT_536528 [Lasiosphaeria hispida]|uniref:Uncharacterized protein n=1 Tax=Lasiosphaeria hispida TaxID=260671 RepID=A0AAJ0HKK0_9PEZI|nr:hypothetical protein B0T25DRAFT_536528 [Lasiosphaeria hispida]
MVSTDSAALHAQPQLASRDKMGREESSPDTLLDVQQFPEVPYMYVPYLGDNGGRAEPSPTPRDPSTTEPLPDGNLAPTGSLFYLQRVKILQELHAQLKALDKELQSFLAAEDSRWSQWHRSQKDLAGWQAELTSSWFVWWKKKCARLRYSISSRQSRAWNLHINNWLGKKHDVMNKQYLLKAEAERQLRELDNMEKAEKERRLQRLGGMDKKRELRWKEETWLWYSYRADRAKQLACYPLLTW